jgi:hypothetical protein
MPPKRNNLIVHHDELPAVPRPRRVYNYVEFEGVFIDSSSEAIKTKSSLEQETRNIQSIFSVGDLGIKSCHFLILNSKG